MQSDRARDWFDTYTRDLSGRDFQRLFTHDTREAYNFFRRGVQEDEFAALPWWKRVPQRFRQVFVAFTLRLPPARRALYIGALVMALIGVLQLFRGLQGVDVPFGMPFVQIRVPLPVWANGTLALLISFLLITLLGRQILAGVEAHVREPRFTDDLTLLILKRHPPGGHA